MLPPSELEARMFVQGLNWRDDTDPHNNSNRNSTVQSASSGVATTRTYVSKHYNYLSASEKREQEEKEKHIREGNSQPQTQPQPQPQNHAQTPIPIPSSPVLVIPKRTPKPTPNTQTQCQTPKRRIPRKVKLYSNSHSSSSSSSSSSSKNNKSIVNPRKGKPPAGKRTKTTMTKSSHQQFVVWVAAQFSKQTKTHKSQDPTQSPTQSPTLSYFKQQQRQRHMNTTTSSSSPSHHPPSQSLEELQLMFWHNQVLQRKRKTMLRLKNLKKELLALERVMQQKSRSKSNKNKPKTLLSQSQTQDQNHIATTANTANTTTLLSAVAPDLSSDLSSGASKSTSQNQHSTIYSNSPAHKKATLKATTIATSTTSSSFSSSSSSSYSSSSPQSEKELDQKQKEMADVTGVSGPLFLPMSSDLVEPQVKNSKAVENSDFSGDDYDCDFENDEEEGDDDDDDNDDDDDDTDDDTEDVHDTEDVPHETEIGKKRKKSKRSSGGKKKVNDGPKDNDNHVAKRRHRRQERRTPPSAQPLSNVSTNNNTTNNNTTNNNTTTTADMHLTTLKSSLSLYKQNKNVNDDDDDDDDDEDLAFVLSNSNNANLAGSTPTNLANCNHDIFSTPTIYTTPSFSLTSQSSFSAESSSVTSLATTPTLLTPPPLLNFTEITEQQQTQQIQLGSMPLSMLPSSPIKLTASSVMGMKITPQKDIGTHAKTLKQRGRTSAKKNSTSQHPHPYPHQNHLALPSSLNMYHSDSVYSRRLSAFSSIPTSTTIMSTSTSSSTPTKEYPIQVTQNDPPLVHDPLHLFAQVEGEFMASLDSDDDNDDDDEFSVNTTTNTTNTNTKVEPLESVQRKWNDFTRMGSSLDLPEVPPLQKSLHSMDAGRNFPSSRQNLRMHVDESFGDGQVDVLRQRHTGTADRHLHSSAMRTSTTLDTEFDMNEGEGEDVFRPLRFTSRLQVPPPHNNTNTMYNNIHVLVKPKAVRIVTRMPILNHAEYVCSVQPGDLYTGITQDLTVERVGYGRVVFPGSTNLHDIQHLSLTDVLKFEHKAFIAFEQQQQHQQQQEQQEQEQQEQEQQEQQHHAIVDTVLPPVGMGLNKMCVVELFHVWPQDKHTGDVICDPQALLDRRYAETLLAKTEKMGAQFYDYDPTKGSWRFMLPHL